MGLTYLFVAHDLSMVRHISDRIGVMYLGKIVESGDSDEVYDNPCHPYTRALLASIPIADPKRALSLEHCGIEGDLPSPLHVPSGCRFHTRCPYATDQCRQQERNWKREHRAIWWHAGKNKKSEEQIEICFQKNFTEPTSRS